MPDKHRLHIETLTWKMPHMQLTEAVYARAAARHPDLATRLDVTFGVDGQGFADNARDAEFIMGSNFPRENLAAVAPRLRWVHVPSAGVEGFMPFDWLPEGVAFTNNRGTHVARAREYGLMALTMLNAGMPRTLTNQRAARWEQHFSTVIEGRHVVVFGLGNMGGAVAEAAKMLGMRVTGVKRSPGPHPHADAVVGPERLRAVLAGADYLVVTTPLTPETRGKVNAAELDAMRPGAGVVNMGRAAVMDYAALCTRLDDGRIGGAVLDVFDPEPLPPDSPLWRQKNLVITPHNCSDDPEHYIPNSLDIFFDNFGRLLRGEPLVNRVDRSLGY